MVAERSKDDLQEGSSQTWQVTLTPCFYRLAVLCFVSYLSASTWYWWVLQYSNIAWRWQRQRWKWVQYGAFRTDRKINVSWKNKSINKPWNKTLFVTTIIDTTGLRACGRASSIFTSKDWSIFLLPPLDPVLYYFKISVTKCQHWISTFTALLTEIASLYDTHQCSVDGWRKLYVPGDRKY